MQVPPETRAGQGQAALACPACSAGRDTDDRFCTECGAPLPALDAVAPPGAGPGELQLGPGMAAATDTGLRHTENEDAFAIGQAADDAAILVVCDGVSNSQSPGLAAAAAADAARSTVVVSLARGEDARIAITRAIERAHDMVCAVPFDPKHELDPPAATVIAAVAQPGPEGRARVTVGWLGDSRAYWLSRDAGRLLSRDHSWRNLAVDRGEMTEAQARLDPLAGALVKCLGTTDVKTATPCPEPCVESFDLPRQGCLLLCTDGLWKYAESPTGLLAAAAGTLWSGNALQACRQLVSFANGRGGHDNITVAVAQLGPP